MAMCSGGAVEITAALPIYKTLVWHSWPALHELLLDALLLCCSLQHEFCI